MARSLRYSIVVAFTLIFIICCTAGSAWGFTYDNPAEAAFSNTRFELVLPYISFGGHNNLFTVNDLDLDLDQPGVKADILARLDENDFDTNFATELKAGLTIGRFSLQVRPFASGSAQMDYGLPKLILLETDRTNADHNLVGSKLNALTGTSLDLTYGHPFTLSSNSHLGVGVTLRYVRGYSLVKAEVTRGTVVFNKEDLEKTELDVEYRSLHTEFPDKDPTSASQLIQSLFQNPSGTGFLADLGVVYDHDRFRAGLALKNIGVIKWNNLREDSYRCFGEITEDGFDIDFEEQNKETRIPNYSLSLPLVLQAQGSYRLLGNLYWHLGMEKGFADGWGISSKPCYQTGLEWRPRHLLRLAGNLSYQDGALGYDGLVELHLFCFWLNLHLGWVGEGDGVYAAAMTALHF